jgi:periplasmic divalent cation tolerance protein
MSPDESAVLILSTTPRGGGNQIAETLVAEGLVACVNIAEIRSYFRWKGEFAREEEELLIIKTIQRRSEEVQERIRTLHPYELPEILVLNIDGGFAPFLAWIAEATR